MSGTEEKLKRVVRGCVLGCLEDVLGAAAAGAVTSLIAPETAYDDPAEFHQKLYSLMKGPAFTLESLIIRALFGQLHLKLEPAKYDFVECIGLAKKQGQSSPGIRDGVVA